MSNNPTVRYDLRMVLPTESLLERAALQELGRTRGNVVQSSTPSRVADALREQISGGKFPPGARLREEAVAEALQVSRNTVREAFVELTGDRLVVREPNRGVFVATLTATDVMDIIAARRIIEVAAVRNGGSPVLLANARLAASEGMAARDAGDDDAAARADRHFHRALVAFARCSPKSVGFSTPTMLIQHCSSPLSTITKAFVDNWKQENRRPPHEHWTTS